MHQNHSPVKTPNRLLSRPAIAALCLSISMCVLTGCNYFILLGYLLGGPPSIEPPFDADTRKSMTDYETSVAVVCYAPNDLKWDFDKIDSEVAKYVSFRLGEHKIKFANPDVVRAWLDKNPDWDHPEEIGEALGVTYVIYIDLHKFSMYEQGSATLFRGRAEALVSVYEMDEEGAGEKIWTKELTSEYPTRAPRSTSDETYNTFKKKYLARLSDQVGRFFYEHFALDDIHEAT